MGKLIQKGTLHAVISWFDRMIFASNASMQDDASNMDSLTDNEEPVVD